MNKPFVSTIIPTIGRPVLGRAVKSVLEQSVDVEHEIIVVNDSGSDLKWEAWQTGENIQIVNTPQRERRVARNTGAAIARGKYLHFLDDDDWLLPNGLNALIKTAHAHPEAGWVVGGLQLVDRADQELIQLHFDLPPNCFTQVMAGEWLPMLASLIRAEDFFAIGGFEPINTYSDDIGLARRMMLRTNIACCPQIVACAGVGPLNSTTNIPQGRKNAQDDRERVLNTRFAFARMHASAGNSFWRGRVVRTYLTSLVWNANDFRPLVVLNRLAYAALAVGLYWRDWFREDFWRAIIKPYQSEIFARGF
jgi:glycosyltransferase involved in cell wall biosynthesis